MISTRFAPMALVLLVLALVPVALHTYVGATYDDGVRVSAVPEVLAGMRSEPARRSANWGQRRFGTDEWFDRWYGAGQRLRLTVVRTYDAKTVYHHPELAISYPEASLGRAAVEKLPSGEPVFVLRGIDESRDLVAYALLADEGFVENPYVFQVTSAMKMLVGGRRPMTLVYVQDREPPAGEFARQPAARVLAAALAAMRSAERPDAAP